MIPYGRQSIDDQDVAAVVEVLHGDWLTQGPAVEAFEAALCDITEAPFAVAFANGTAALHAAAAAAGLGAGDRVAVPALTFSATAACARYVGASIDLVDIDPMTLCIDLGRVPIEADAVIAVHYAGLPTDLGRLARRPRIVIEDACHALGASTPDGPVGNCARSDMCCFSFHPVKPITTAEGGAVTTADPALAERLRRFRNHGIERRPDIAGWYYEVVDVGFNYRLPDVLAALGRSQLRRLADFIAARNRLAERYRDLLAGSPVELPPSAPLGSRHGYHLFAVQVDRRAEVYESLRQAGIAAQVHYVPIHHHPTYRALGLDDADLANTDRAYDRLLSIPLHPGLTEAEQDRVVAALLAAT